MSDQADPETLGKHLYSQIIKRSCKEIKNYHSLQQRSLQNSQHQSTDNKENHKDIKKETKDASKPPVSDKKKKHLAKTFDIKIEND